MKPACKAHGCDRVGDRKGYCSMHYQRMRKHGAVSDDVLSRQPTGRLRQWISEAISYRGDDCLSWPFTKHYNGYGNITIDGRTHMPHRIVCIAVHGAAPSDEHEVAHSCGTPACCTPSHLRWATKKENAADRLTHGTQKHGEAHHKAKLSNADVTYIRNSRGVTHSALAKRFGVSFQTISAIRLGKHRLNDDANFKRREAV